MKSKKCSKCGYTKPLEDFHKNRSRGDGLRSICKECQKSLGKEYYLKNKDKISEYYKKHKKARQAYQKEYASKNKEKNKIRFLQAEKEQEGVMKKCIKCLEIKDRDQFDRQLKNRDGRRNTCKSCCREQKRERRKLTKKLLLEYKGGKCEICGIVGPPYIFDFHHKDKNEKDFNIGKSDKSIKQLKIEVDKCMLVCCLCHRKIHAEEM